VHRHIGAKRRAGRSKRLNRGRVLGWKMDHHEDEYWVYMPEMTTGFNVYPDYRRIFCNKNGTSLHPFLPSARPKRAGYAQTAAFGHNHTRRFSANCLE